MFKCVKCDEIVTDGSRICRKCGSIIDEVSDPTEQLAPMEDDSLIVAESIADVEVVEATPDLEGRSSATEKHWQCPTCSAEVPWHFVICWKCQHAREPDTPVETPEPIPEPQPQPKPLTEPVVARATLICPKCGSDAVVPNARIHISAQGELEVALAADDSPTNRPGRLSAHICERCGYVELRVSNPDRMSVDEE